MWGVAVRYGLDNPKKADLLDWLIDPVQGDLNSQAKWGKANGVAEATITKWKKDPKFRQAWSTELAKRNVSPDRVQTVIDAMFEKAQLGDTTAAKLVLDYTNRFAPPTELEAADDASELSDAELEAEYARLVADEHSRRLGGHTDDGDE